MRHFNWKVLFCPKIFEQYLQVDEHLYGLFWTSKSDIINYNKVLYLIEFYLWILLWFIWTNIWTTRFIIKETYEVS